MRGATPRGKRDTDDLLISTHTPHAGRDLVAIPPTSSHEISTHTPHAGRDTSIDYMHWHLFISTHTPHAGRDDNILPRIEIALHFYSHAPCGARRVVESFFLIILIFLLTRPMRGATMHICFTVFYT